jgi:hypothetical protein
MRYLLTCSLALTACAEASASSGGVIEVPCTPATDQRVRTAERYETQLTRFRAVVEIAAAPRYAPQIEVALCDREVWGEATEPCPEGWTCEQAGRALPPQDCVVGVSAAMADDGTLWVDCGSRYRVWENGESLSDSGAAWRTAYVRLP